MKIILASSSKYRKSLLQSLKIPFETISPKINEELSNEISLNANSKQIAQQKALKIADSEKSAIIIGSDQICALENKRLRKPGNYQKAFEQLSQCKAKQVTFYTGICVYNSDTKEILVDSDVTKVNFRNYEDFEIKNYLIKDEPYDCAGSFKMESLGTSLFDSVITTDPTALIGLPMIKLNTMLRQLGMNPLGDRIE